MTKIMCIRCRNNKATAKSHVIPNSIRKRMFGEEFEQGKKFSFKYIGRKELPTQDFPKPHLMCVPCDNKFGADIERDLPSLLMPVKVDDPNEWEKLGLIQLDHGPFKAYPTRFQPILEKNAALISWKVMHEVAINEKPDLLDFLKSPDGQKLDFAMLDFIDKGSLKSSDVQLKNPVFWKIEPKTAAAITGKCDELPVSWRVLYDHGKPETASIFAVFGLWVVGWQLPQSVIPLEVSLALCLQHIMEHREK